LELLRVAYARARAWLFVADHAPDRRQPRLARLNRRRPWPFVTVFLSDPLARPGRPASDGSDVAWWACARRPR